MLVKGRPITWNVHLWLCSVSRIVCVEVMYVQAVEVCVGGPLPHRLGAVVGRAPQPVSVQLPKCGADASYVPLQRSVCNVARSSRWGALLASHPLLQRLGTHALAGTVRCAFPRYVSAAVWDQPILTPPCRWIVPRTSLPSASLGLASYRPDSPPALQRRFRPSIHSDTQRTIPWTFTSTTVTHPWRLQLPCETSRDAES